MTFVKAFETFPLRTTWCNFAVETSKLWQQIIADTFQLPVVLHEAKHYGKVATIARGIDHAHVADVLSLVNHCVSFPEERVIVANTVMRMTPNAA